MKPKLSSFTSACCCLICAMSCACEGCIIYRYTNPDVVFDAKRILIDAIKEKERLDREERKNYMLAKMRSLQLVVTTSGRYYYTWRVGVGENAVQVCRQGFQTAYVVSSWYTDDLIIRIKNGDVNADLLITDRSALSKKSGITDPKVTNFCEHFGITLSRMQVRAMRVPNTVQSLSTVAWMNYYFKLIGDNVPNAAEELHLEPVKRQQIHEEYCADMHSCCHELGAGPMCIASFRELWRQVFSYVKIRKFKHCCGKCNLCAALSLARRQFMDARGREEVTMLFVLHRVTYMGEREMYYARRHLAMIEKWNYISTISDGMQQNRCQLPWFGNNKTSPVHIKQHLQGILMHGRNMRVYRSFSNVSINANYCVHTWLLSLEEIYKAKGKLTSTLFHQIDGGSENANVLFLVICFLLVAKGLCTKVVLTRLLPGHTHEDIDALFALIWNMLKDEYILTPEEFKVLIGKAFKKIVDPEVVDIHACPNYEAWTEGYCDSDLGRFAKEEWTQLQFTFERVGDDEKDRYPMGVKSTYKAYSQDEVIEIVDDPNKESITNLIPQLTLCPVCPSEDEPPLCIMKAFPPASRTITVDPFIAGSRAYTVACADRMERTYADQKPEVAAEWAKWRDDVAPQSDIATDHIAEHPMHIPFHDILFGSARGSDFEVGPRPRRDRTVNGVTVPEMRIVTATSSMNHSGSKAKAKSSRLVVESADGEDVSTQNITAQAHILGPPKKQRTKKATTGAATTANSKSESNKKKKVVAAEAAAAKKKKAASKRGGREEEGESDDNDDDDDDDDGSSSSDDEAVVVNFTLNEEISNKHKLSGHISKCNVDGTYNVKYKDGRSDVNVESKLLFKVVKKVVKEKGEKRPASTAVKWDMELVTEAWVDTGGLQDSHVVVGKRQRKKTTNNFS
jgi:hypothetical protein